MRNTAATISECDSFPGTDVSSSSDGPTGTVPSADPFLRCTPGRTHRRSRRWPLHSKSRRSAQPRHTAGRPPDSRSWPPQAPPRARRPRGIEHTTSRAGRGVSAQDAINRIPAISASTFVLRKVIGIPIGCMHERGRQNIGLANAVTPAVSLPFYPGCRILSMRTLEPGLQRKHGPYTFPLSWHPNRFVDESSIDGADLVQWSLTPLNRVLLYRRWVRP